MLKDYTKENLRADCEDAELDFNATLEKMEQWDAKKWALFEYVNENVEAVEEISDLDDIDADEIHFYGEDLLVLTDSEADDRWDEELDSYIDEVILPEIPEFCRNYFDCEKWKDDARYDGRGHAIARYDSEENEYFLQYEDGTEDEIFIYRMN